VERLHIHSTDIGSTLPARIEPQSRGREGLTPLAIVADGNRIVSDSNRIAPRGQKGTQRMGAARTVTSVARAACQDFYEEVMRTIADGRVDELEERRLRKSWTVANARLAIADGRMHAIRLLSGDVQDVRNIEATCATAAVNPVIFDLDPDPLSAA